MVKAPSEGMGLDAGDGVDTGDEKAEAGLAEPEPRSKVGVRLRPRIVVETLALALALAPCPGPGPGPASPPPRSRLCQPGGSDGAAGKRRDFRHFPLRRRPRTNRSRAAPRLRSSRATSLPLETPPSSGEAGPSPHCRRNSFWGRPGLGWA